MSGRWSGIGRPAILSSPRPPAAVAVCAAGEPVGRLEVGGGHSRLPVIGSGEAGGLPPAAAALQVGWAGGLVGGDRLGAGLGPSVAARALASQV